MNIDCGSNKKLTLSSNMKVCQEKYIISHKIGEGNFGNYEKRLGRFLKNKEFAIKVERDVPGKQPQLPNEIEILKTLNAKENSQVGFPEIHEYGVEKGNHYVIMELLGPNLMELLKICGGKFSLETIIILAMQMFQRIQFLHSKGFIYRDIKPENFMMGCGDSSSILYMIDFGLCLRFCDHESGLHRPYKEDRSFNGTQRYASICSHLRIEQSRRDDLQSLCYLLIFLAKGELPWQNCKNENVMDSKEKWILDKKTRISPQSLCSGLPLQLSNILEYVLELQFYQDPDYNYIHSQIGQMYDRFILDKVFIYDWAKLPKNEKIEKDGKIISISPPKAKNIMDENSDESLSSQENSQAEMQGFYMEQSHNDA